jgi:hypothetical protein
MKENLTIQSFCRHYIVDCFSEKLSKKDQKISLAASIVLGICFGGLLHLMHLGAHLCSLCTKKVSHLNKHSLSASVTPLERTAGKIVRCTQGDPSLLRAWIEQHGKNYFAHAIWDASAQVTVLNEGQLSCAEAVLRKTRKVEYEKGSTYGTRGTDQLPTLTDSDQKELNEVTASFGEKSTYGNIQLPFGIHVQTKTVMKITYPIKFGYDVMAWEKYREAVERLARKYGCSQAAITIAYDLSKPSEERIDAQLAKLYQALQRDLISANATLVANMRKHDPDADGDQIGVNIILNNTEQNGFNFDAARQRAIFQNKLNPDIRGAENCIAWGYGDCVVLKGNAHTMSRGKVELVSKGPWENQGEFYSINLNDPDVLVLVTRKVFETYQKTPGATRAGQVLIIEDLPQDLLEYFKVPDRLRNPLVQK